MNLIRPMAEMPWDIFLREMPVQAVFAMERKKLFVFRTESIDVSGSN